MIQLNPIVLLALGELLFISMVVSLGLTVAGLIRKSNERKAVAKLIRRIKEDQARRRDETRTLMQKSYGFEGQELDAIVKKISREESRFYQTLIKLFLKRDLNLLEVLHVECEGVTEPYRTLQIARPDAGQDDDLESDLSAEVAMLKEENERLYTELGVTMDTMGKMLKEYAFMYSGGSEESLDKAKLIESFRASGNDSRMSGTASVGTAERSRPGSTGGQVTTPDDRVIEKEELSEAASDQNDLRLLDDAVEFDIDIDIGEMLEDQTVVIDGMEELSILNDETLLMEVSDDELVELEDEDSSLEKTIVDNGQVLEEREGRRQKSPGQ